MKAAQPLVGILLALLGVVWIGQGLGYIPGSFMTGVPFWAFAGAVCLLVGTALVYRTVRRPKPKT